MNGVFENLTWVPEMVGLLAGAMRPGGSGGGDGVADTPYMAGPDWQFSLFDSDAADDKVGPTFAPLVALWRDKGAGGIPAWRDFDILDFEAWWGWVSVYDAVAGDPLTFDVRLWGTRLVENLGHDATRKRLDITNVEATSDARSFSQCDLKFLREVLDRRMVGLFNGQLDARLGNRYRYREVSLPLSSDGETCDKVLNVAQVLDQSGTVAA